MPTKYNTASNKFASHPMGLRPRTWPLAKTCTLMRTKWQTLRMKVHLPTTFTVLRQILALISIPTKLTLTPEDWTIRTIIKRAVTKALPSLQRCLCPRRRLVRSKRASKPWPKTFWSKRQLDSSISSTMHRWIFSSTTSFRQDTLNRKMSPLSRSKATSKYNSEWTSTRISRWQRDKRSLRLAMSRRVTSDQLKICMIWSSTNPSASSMRRRPSRWMSWTPRRPRQNSPKHSKRCLSWNRINWNDHRSPSFSSQRWLKKRMSWKVSQILASHWQNKKVNYLVKSKRKRTRRQISNSISATFPSSMTRVVNSPKPQNLARLVPQVTVDASTKTKNRRWTTSAAWKT